MANQPYLYKRSRAAALLHGDVVVGAIGLDWISEPYRPEFTLIF